MVDISIYSTSTHMALVTRKDGKNGVNSTLYQMLSFLSMMHQFWRWMASSMLQEDVTTHTGMFTGDGRFTCRDLIYGDFVLSCLCSWNCKSNKGYSTDDSYRWLKKSLIFLKLSQPVSKDLHLFKFSKTHSAQLFTLSSQIADVAVRKHH